MSRAICEHCHERHGEKCGPDGWVEGLWFSVLFWPAVALAALRALLPRSA